MSTYTKNLLSSSVDGMQIVINSNGTSTANLIHQAPAGTGSLDEVYIYAFNPNAAAATLVLCWGGTNVTTDAMTSSITGLNGRVLLVDGRLITNGRSVWGYCSTGTVSIDGFVNRIS